MNINKIRKLYKNQNKIKGGKIMWKEFKEFAFKGNVLDMAIGVIIGGAFGKIVTSIVNDIIMPFFGFITSGTNFKDLKWILSPAIIEGDKIVSAEAAITYGNFIQNIVDFIIIAISIFFIIKFIGKIKFAKLKKEDVEEQVEDSKEKDFEPSEVDLLIEIRDLLKEESR